MLLLDEARATVFEIDSGSNSKFTRDELVKRAKRILIRLKAFVSKISIEQHWIESAIIDLEIHLDELIQRPASPFHAVAGPSHTMEVEGEAEDEEEEEEETAEDDAEENAEDEADDETTEDDDDSEEEADAEENAEEKNAEDETTGDDDDSEEEEAEGLRIIQAGSTQDGDLPPSRTRASRGGNAASDAAFNALLQSAYTLIRTPSATGGDDLRRLIRTALAELGKWVDRYQRAHRMIRALESKLSRVGDAAESPMALSDSQQADGQWLVERIVARLERRDGNGRSVYLVRFHDPEMVWPAEKTTSVSPALVRAFLADRKKRGVDPWVVEDDEAEEGARRDGGDDGGGGDDDGGDGDSRQWADSRQRALASVRDLVAKTERVLASSDARMLPALIGRAMQAATTAASAVSGAEASLNVEERRWLASRVQLSMFALEARSALAFPLREASDRIRQRAAALRVAVAELVKQLAGDPTEEEEQGCGGGGDTILVQDKNTATIRFSLIKRIKAVSVVPAAPEWLLPALEELLVTSIFRAKCSYWSGPSTARQDDEAVNAMWVMTAERREKVGPATRVAAHAQTRVAVTRSRQSRAAHQPASLAFSHRAEN